MNSEIILGRYYIDTCKDFDDTGKMVDAKGFYVGVVDKAHTAMWFETKDEAIAAIHADHNSN